jgi:hypothetical protein
VSTLSHSSMSFPTMTPFEVISLGDISISLRRGHYHFASTGGSAEGGSAEVRIERADQVDGATSSGLSASIMQWISERGARMARRDD